MSDSQPAGFTNPPRMRTRTPAWVRGRSMDPVGAVPELAGLGDVPVLAVTCAAAFSDDAMIRWPMPDATPAMLQELFRVILTPYVDFGVLWKIHDCDGQRGCRQGWPSVLPRSSRLPGLASTR